MIPRRGFTGLARIGHFFVSFTGITTTRIALRDVVNVSLNTQETNDQSRCQELSRSGAGF